MRSTTPVAFQIHPIRTDVLEVARGRRLDASGSPVERLVATGGEPVRDGQDPETAIAELLADPNVVQIHSRNISYGCYMFTITRAGCGG